MTFNQIQNFQYVDKYSRFNSELGRRETWEETVTRAVNFLRELSDNKLPIETYDRLWHGIHTMKVMPSMRLLASAGAQARRQNSSLYNCSYTPIDSIDAFVEILLLSMNGSGVGYSVESQYVNQLPVIKPKKGYSFAHIVADSTEGWATSLRTALEAAYEGYDVIFDYSRVRPAGAVLKTKGGQASGPEPLQNLHQFIQQTFDNARGRRLTTLEAHDLACEIGTASISGGSRRTALISLFDRADPLMLSAKSGEFHPRRWNANNSAVWDDRITPQEFSKLFDEMIESNNGEPGIFNRDAAERTKPERREGAVYGTNPCFAAGTLVHTRNGDFPIETLIGKTVDVWDGNAWYTVDNFRVTGKNQPMLRVTLQDGSSLVVTEYHKFIKEDGFRVEAHQLVVGDALAISTAPESHGNIHENGTYLKGFMLGDGTQSRGLPQLWLYNTKYSCQERLLKSASEIPNGEVNTNASDIVDFTMYGESRKRMTGIAPKKDSLLPWVTTYRKSLPPSIFAWDAESKIEFIAGLFDADATALDSKHGWGYQLTSVNYKMLQDVQSLLKTLGVNSKLSLSKSAGEKDFDDGYGAYDIQALWRLSISQKNSVILAQKIKFDRLLSFSERNVSYAVKPKFSVVASIEPDEESEFVYCCTVDSTHAFGLTCGILSAQCGEIVLRPNQLCNLSVVVARHDDTERTLREKVELATIIGTIQSMADNFPGLRKVWSDNSKEERLLGVDITGQMDSPEARKPTVQRHLKDFALVINRYYAKKLGINPSAAVTTVKPSGNSAQLLDCSSGLHARWSKYYIRNIRVFAHSPVFQVLKASGVPMTPENGQDAATANTWVVPFPVASPKNAIVRNDMSALNQCGYWKSVKTHWTEHNPSVTITYKHDEVDTLRNWVWNNRDILGGMSFLPYSDSNYQQMPYEEIDATTYDRLSAKFPAIDWSLLSKYEQYDMSTASQEMACVGGACDFK